MAEERAALMGRQECRTVPCAEPFRVSGSGYGSAGLIMYEKVSGFGFQVFGFEFGSAGLIVYEAGGDLSEGGAGGGRLLQMAEERATLVRKGGYFQALQAAKQCFRFGGGRPAQTLGHIGGVWVED